MSSVLISEDIVPIGEFKAKAAHWLKRVSIGGRSIVITQNGKAAGVLVPPAEYDRLHERERFIEVVSQGLADSDAGRVLDDEALGCQLDERYGALEP